VARSARAVVNAAMPELQPVLVTYTLFEDVTPREKIERADVPWSDLVKRITNAATYIDKAHCPLISLAEYGETRTEANCIRHAQNVRRIFGVELDYDGEQMSLGTAAHLLQGADIQSVLYTSPSHKPDRPRWRVLLPLSEPALPEKRAEYVGRVNRILGGVASRESFTLSQSFYIGRVRGAEYETAETVGRYIDVASDIDPQYHAGKVADGTQIRDMTTDAQLRDAFERGEDRYQAMLKLSSRWAARGMAVDDITAALDALFADGNSLNGDGVDLRSRCRPMAESAVRKFGETRAVVSPPVEIPPNVDLETGETFPQEPEVIPPARLTDQRINWSELARQTAPDREWAIKGWLGMGHVTLLAGPPGAGKTALAQVIGSAISQGYEVIDYVPKARRVLMWAGEDDRDELWRRQKAIAQWMGYPLEAFQQNLIVLPLDQHDIALVETVNGKMEATPKLTELREQIGDLGAEVVILDSVARTFGGNENDRHNVTRYIAGLQWAGAPTSAAMLLIGHPAKAAGSEFSGSTAWEASVRARLFFGYQMPDQPQDPENPPDPLSPVRYLAKRKTNYSTRDWREVRYANGVMTPQTPDGNEVRQHRPAGCPGRVDAQPLPSS
jgi:hypothetical protein